MSHLWKHRWPDPPRDDSGEEIPDRLAWPIFGLFVAGLAAVFWALSRG